MLLKNLVAVPFFASLALGTAIKNDELGPAAGPGGIPGHASDSPYSPTGSIPSPSTTISGFVPSGPTDDNSSAISNTGSIIPSAFPTGNSSNSTVPTPRPMPSEIDSPGNPDSPGHISSPSLSNSTGDATSVSGEPASSGPNGFASQTQYQHVKRDDISSAVPSAIASGSSAAGSNSTKPFALKVYSQDGELDGKAVTLKAAESGAGLYDAIVGGEELQSFVLSGAILQAQAGNENETVYAQIDTPIDTYIALTFTNTCLEGEIEKYVVQDNRLVFNSNYPTEWYACANSTSTENPHVALYPRDAPQLGCKGIQLVVSYD
ncbi:hypothetical protein TRVA0_053S01200 [Trichomonascus vanleenenianus]|uniref:uncharacterized protein n=1 Tax=Trichomonascus vanleenenianus TaxID=2268995 RepID=UPI003ECB144B